MGFMLKRAARAPWFVDCGASRPIHSGLSGASMGQLVSVMLSMMQQRDQAKFAGYTTKLEHQQILNALRPAGREL